MINRYAVLCYDAASNGKDSKIETRFDTEGLRSNRKSAAGAFRRESSHHYHPSGFTLDIISFEAYQSPISNSCRCILLTSIGPPPTASIIDPRAAGLILNWIVKVQDVVGVCNGAVNLLVRYEHSFRWQNFPIARLKIFPESSRQILGIPESPS